jgi:cell wall-associated NlpC family hydrolase
VAALSTFAFPGPSIKLPPAAVLPMGARVPVKSEDSPFAITREGHHLPRTHLALLDEKAADYVAVAERFVGTPYLWGGKSVFGIDCSGLVQLSLHAAGIAALRDSDMQQATLGRALDSTEWHDLRRGDLLFWKGHVAIARDATTIVHANAHHMATVIENTGDAIARIKAAGSELVAIKRI